MPLTDPLVFPAVALATVLALAAFGLFRLGVRVENAAGSTPIWAYAFVALLVGFGVLLLLASAFWSFASHLLMALSGIAVGSMAVFWVVQALLRLRRWRRED